MKVKDLIKALENFDPELRVVIDAESGGVIDPIGLQTVIIATNINKIAFKGPHEIIRDNNPVWQNTVINKETAIYFHK